MKAKGEELVNKTTVEDFKAYVREYLVKVETAKLEDDETLDEEAIDSKIDGLLKTHVTKSSVDEDVYEWLFDKNRKNGETWLDADDKTGNYTVYMVNTPSYIDDYTTKNGAYIYLSNSANTDEDGASAKADEIIKEWNESDKSADTFLAFTEKYSESGHLHEIIKNIDKYESYSDALYAEDAVVGEVSKLVSTSESGVFIVYYDGDGDLKAWEADVDTALRNADYQEDYEEMTETYSVTTVEDKVNSIIPVSISTSSN